MFKIIFICVCVSIPISYAHTIPALSRFSSEQFVLLLYGHLHVPHSFWASCTSIFWCLKELTLNCLKQLDLVLLNALEEKHTSVGEWWTFPILSTRQLQAMIRKGRFTVENSATQKCRGLYCGLGKEGCIFTNGQTWKRVMAVFTYSKATQRLFIIGCRGQHELFFLG